MVFGLYFALCGVVALLVALRDRAPGAFGRVLLISAAVVHGLLGAFAGGLVGWGRIRVHDGRARPDRAHTSGVRASGDRSRRRRAAG